MSEFLKKIKDSVDNGNPDKEIVDHHFAVLKGVSMNEKLKQDQFNEEKLYTDEIRGFVLDEGELLENSIKYDKDNVEFVGTNNAPTEMINNINAGDTNNEVLKKFEENMRDRDSIVINEHQIELLQLDIKNYERRIEKNIELIEYLKEENKKLNG